ncbi:centrosomal protein of 120 kDa-like isoform X3 [Zootermopsis nevadensis]|nr:centrosomal protein of 120 kDa-like isoform X3 [Zootermopsis nevadensis]
MLCSLRVEGRPEIQEKGIQLPSKDTNTKNNQQKQPVTQPLNGSLVTQLHSDKGIIQIGSDETATDNFELTIYVGQAVNLDLLFPGNYNAENRHISFHYSIMDYAVDTAKIALTDIYKPVPFNKKMVVSLRSSLENLHQYFSTSSKLRMKLITGQDEIGFTEISMQGLIPTTSKSAFCTLNDESTVTIESPCFLKVSNTGEVPTSPSGLQPYIHLRIRLKYQNIEWNDTDQGEDQFWDMENEPASLLRSSSYTVLDAPIQSVFEVPNVDIQDSGHVSGPIIQHGVSIKTNDISEQNTNKNVHRSGYTQKTGDEVEAGNMAQLLKEMKVPSGQSQLFVSAGQLRSPCAQIISKDYRSQRIFHDSSTQAQEQTDEPYHIYSLDITIQTVTFQHLPPRKRCYFKFHHPKAQTISNSNPEIIIKETNKSIGLQDVKCKLTFLSTPGEINHVLLAWPPKISVCDTVQGLSTQLAVGTLNIGPALVENLKLCHYNIPLIDLRTVEEVGTLAIGFTLDDLGPKQIEDKTVLNLGSATLDDHFVFKIVEELEDWKERQQELFKAELKKKEEAHIAALNEEWKRRHMEIEKNFNHKVEECQRLAQSLNDTTDELRLKTCKCAQREQELNRYKEIIERKYKLKVLEMKDAIKRIEGDFSLKCVKLERDKEDLEDKILRTEKENAELKETITAQEHSLNKIKKASLKKDQTDLSLLQELKSTEEKLESALKAKSFFKEQWARAFREINHLKNEHQQDIQIQIKHNKEELRDLGLQHLLSKGEQGMKEDQSMIQQLRSEMNTIHTNCGLGDTSQQNNEIVNPHVAPQHHLPNSARKHLLHSEKPNSDASLNRPTSLQQKMHEPQISALVEERDTLMNTGTYSLQDPVIVKLNEEIRTLLLNYNEVTEEQKLTLL